MKNVIKHLALGAISITLFAGCMEDGGSGNAGGNAKADGNAVLEQMVIENIAQNVIVATYKDLRDQTKELAALAVDLKTAPTQAKLDAIQAKWKSARIPWESTEGFLFGPVDSLGVDPAIDSWPLSKLDLDTILATRPNIDAAFVRQLGTDVQGFHTAEYLIFGDGVNSNTKLVKDMTAPQLQYLVAVTQVLAEQTQKLYVSWTERHDPTDVNSKSYVDIVQKPGLNNEFYASRSAVLQEYVQGMVKIAVEVGKGKISDPLGGNIGAADPSIVESQFSWNSLTDFQNNVRSMQNLYTGNYLNRDGAGMDEIVKLKNPELNAKILAQITAAEKAIGDIAGQQGLSFTKAIKDEGGRQRSLAAIEALAKLEATLQNELLPLFQ